MMNPESTGLVFAGAFLAFHNGLQRGRARHNAYVAATIEGRRRDAEAANLRDLTHALNRQVARADAAAAQAVASRILRGLR